MNVILISPNDRNNLENAGDRAPLGVLYIAGALEKGGHSVKIIDLNHDKVDDEITKFNPDFIGISFSTSQYYQAVNLCEFFKNIPDIKLIAGGVHPTVDPDSCYMFDYVISGEGENIICDIVETSPKIKHINGAPVVNLDNLSLPWHLLNMKRYNMEIDGVRTATLVTSRGCPGSCVFCSRLFGNEFRFASAEWILKQIVHLWENYDYTSFYFYDDAFTADKKRVIELCKLLKKEKHNFTFRLTSRADLINEPIVKALASIGTKFVSLGIEHIDDKVLKMCGKRMKIADNLKAVELLHKYGIKVKGFFILNLPLATKSSVRKTINWAKKHLDYYDFYNLVAFPGTPIWKYREKFGLNILSSDYGFWEAGKKLKYNIENPAVPNDYLNKILKRERQ